jgi:hypothetical protein
MTRAMFFSRVTGEGKFDRRRGEEAIAVTLNGFPRAGAAFDPLLTSTAHFR